MASNKKIVIIENPQESSLSPEEKEIYEREFKKWQNICEPLAKSSQKSQRITEDDLSLTVTM